MFGGCSTEKDAAKAEAELAEKPQFASPWDKPITRLYGPEATDPAQSPRNEAMSELLNRAGIANANVSKGGGAKPAASLSPWEPGEVPKPRKGAADPREDAAPAGPVSKDWSIALATFNRDTEAAAAQQLLARTRALPGMSDAYLESRGRSMVLAYGRYDAPGSPAAKKDLDRIRDITLQGTKPFHHAVMSPPPVEHLAGSVPDYELRNARRVHGKEVRYTLQIGVYWRPDGNEPTAKEQAEFRAAAEKAATDLRREGEEAYYYHGPRKSMVTVGAFTDKEYDASPQVKNAMAMPNQAPRLIKLREKYPYNLENGQAVKRTMGGATEGRIDPSFVVTIPE